MSLSLAVRAQHVLGGTLCWREGGRARMERAKSSCIWATCGPFVSSKMFVSLTGPRRREMSVRGHSVLAPW